MTRHDKFRNIIVRQFIHYFQYHFDKMKYIYSKNIPTLDRIKKNHNQNLKTSYNTVQKNTKCIRMKKKQYSFCNGMK